MGAWDLERGPEVALVSLSLHGHVPLCPRDTGDAADWQLSSIQVGDSPQTLHLWGQTWPNTLPRRWRKLELNPAGFSLLIFTWGRHGAGLAPQMALLGPPCVCLLAGERGRCHHVLVLTVKRLQERTGPHQGVSKSRKPHQPRKSCSVRWSCKSSAET